MDAVMSDLPGLYINDNVMPVDWSKKTFTITDGFQWLQRHAQSNTRYTMRLAHSENVNPIDISSCLGKAENVSITITAPETKDISLQVAHAMYIDNFSRGSIFTVGSEHGNANTLILDGNITIKGTNNRDSLIRVEKTGTLIMRGNVRITGNNTNAKGGGVYLNGGAFFLENGTISKNIAAVGGGVYVEEGIFKRTGGTISGNNCFYSDATFNDLYISGIE
jgi:hypothetical protein